MTLYKIINNIIEISPSRPTNSIANHGHFLALRYHIYDIVHSFYPELFECGT